MKEINDALLNKYKNKIKEKVSNNWRRVYSVWMVLLAK